MEHDRHKLRLATIALLCVLHIGFGLYARQLPLLICGAAGMAYAAVATVKRCRAARPAGTMYPWSSALPSLGVAEAAELAADLRLAEAAEPAAKAPIDLSDTEALVRRMLAQSRHALLLRRQVVANLRDAEFREACEQLQARMALVPEGDVVLAPATTMKQANRRGRPRRSRASGCMLPRCSSTATR